MSPGFTLIQISTFIMVASLTLVACLPSLPSNQIAAARTAAQMNAILVALRQFESSNARLPCPADATQPVGGTLYGVEAGNNGAAGNCTAASPAANAIDPTNHVALGMLPVRALGLPVSAALDAWGHDITYAVDTNATTCFLGTLPGAIKVSDNGSSVNAVTTLVSYGTDGHGAWIPRTGASGTAVKLNSGATNADELTNAHVSGSFLTTQPLDTFVRKAGSTTFGDLVVYQNPSWNLASVPLVAASLFPILTPPSNATYIAGETLTFVLTYPHAVIVTGSPRLALTIGTSTRYANYASGSGGNALTFTYTLQTTDYAPTGIYIAAPVDMNGGTLSAPCNNFAVPSLTGIEVKYPYIFVTDSVNDRVEEFSASGGYLNKFGSLGVLNGQFLTPKQPVIDASGNVWVSDWVNARVEKFSAGGTYLSQFGSLGVLNGQFTTVGTMAIDGSGNFWVADVGGNRVEEFSPSGTYLSKFGSAGILNGQFLIPTGIAIDSSGNIWVGDFGNSRLEKFSPGGTYLAKFGSLGSGNGQLINPCGHAIDASGNIWVADNGNNRLQKFDANGNYITQFGAYGTGNGKFIGPCGIAIDLAGNIWVGDAGNNRIQKFSASGSYINQFGSWGTGNGQFITPGGLALMYQ